jgi:hypothetical protein
MRLTTTLMPLLIRDSFKSVPSSHGENVHCSTEVPVPHDIFYIPRATHIGFQIFDPRPHLPNGSKGKSRSINVTPPDGTILKRATGSVSQESDNEVVYFPEVEVGHKKVLWPTGEDSLIHVDRIGALTSITVVVHKRDNRGLLRREILNFEWDVPLANLRFAYRAPQHTLHYYTRYCTALKLEHLCMVKLINTELHKTVKLPKLPYCYDTDAFTAHYINARLIEVVIRDFKMPLEPFWGLDMACFVPKTLDFLFDAEVGYDVVID